MSSHIASRAPGQLEDIRELLNSWHVPNDTRAAVDELPAWIVGGAWGERFAVLPRPRSPEALIDLRDGLRQFLAGTTAAVVDRMLAEFPPRLSVRSDGTLASGPADAGDAAAVATWIVFAAAAEGTLTRLRTCPDCGWAFYDSSRNNRRVWCAMTAREGGRGCGSIAKTRAYRARASLEQSPAVAGAGTEQTHPAAAAIPA